MAKSSYTVSQGNPFGRIGGAIGTALSEQVPKEIERQRLSKGLMDFANNSQNLSPQQQIASIAGLPGVTPQLIDTMGQLARQQQVGNQLAQGRGDRFSTKISQPEQNPRDIQFGGERLQGKGPNIPSEQSRNVHPNEIGQPQVNPKNPLREEAQPSLPDTLEEFEDRVNFHYQRNPAGGIESARNLAVQDMNLEREMPEAVRKRDAALRETQERIEGKFKNQLEEKLHKKFEDSSILKDIPGEYYTNLVRGLENDLAEHPNKSENDVINDWSNRALDLSKAKTDLEEYAKTDFGFKNLFNKQAGRDKLDQYSKIYKDAGNSEEYYNYLKSEMGLSPQGAATLAYPVSKNINNLISKISKKPLGLLNESSFINPKTSEVGYREIINDISKNIQDDDSILSIAYALKQKDPFFNQQHFFKEMADKQDELRLNARQRREIGVGVSKWKPTWADFYAL